MKLNADIENDLMERFRKGDQRAFKVVFDRFYQELCYFSYSLTHDEGHGEEIVSGVMEKLWYRHRHFERLDNIKAFLYIATRNASYNFLQSKQRRNNLMNESIETLNEQGEDYVSAAILEIDMLKRIRQEVESFPEQQRMVFKLHFFEELTLEEIAKKMNLAPTTVRTYKFIAVEKLKVLFTKAGLISLALIIHLLLRG